VTARLVHLNGPPGIGKSTLAAVYADRHPGTLNLDVDVDAADAVQGTYQLLADALDGRAASAG
jgi:MoxR-like ATPase